MGCCFIHFSIHVNWKNSGYSRPSTRLVTEKWLCTVLTLRMIGTHGGLSFPVGLVWKGFIEEMGF